MKSENITFKLNITDINMACKERTYFYKSMENSFHNNIKDMQAMFERFIRDYISHRYFDKNYDELLLTQQSYVSSFLNEF